MFSTAAWAAHEVGLATAIGGTIFGTTALEPALGQITSPEERDRVEAASWMRFAPINLAAHAVMAATWFVGRKLLNGREVSADARALTRVKDGLIIGSLITGVASNLFGRMLAKQIDAGFGPEESKDRTGAQQEVKKSRMLQRFSSGFGMLNLAANISILAVTTMLAMKASKSAKFPLWSRRLP
jgi:hypothetical protein